MLTKNVCQIHCLHLNVFEKEKKRKVHNFKVRLRVKVCFEKKMGRFGRISESERVQGRQRKKMKDGDIPFFKR